MRATVFKELIKEIEGNKMFFQKIRDQTNYKVYRKWEDMITVYFPIQDRILKKYNFEVEKFNQNPDQEFKMLYNELYSNLAYHTFEIEKLNLMTPKKVKDFLEFYVKSFNGNKIDEILEEIEKETEDSEELPYSEEFRKDLIRRLVYEIQIKTLHFYGMGNETGWINMMISAQLFFITYNKDFVKDIIQKQSEIYKKLETSFG